MNSLIFLDSRDLIDCVEHQDPCDHMMLGARLRARGLSLVYTFSNVLETVPRKRPLSYAITLLQRLESLPHVFIRHVDITDLEFKEAARAFQVGSEPKVIVPAEAAFWRTLPRPADADNPQWALAHDMLDRLPLSEQLRFAMIKGQGVDFDPIYRQDLQRVLSVQRERLGQSVPSKAVFRLSIRSTLHSRGINVTEPHRFADWMFRNPSVSPGWRLAHEAFQELRLDRRVVIKSGDLPDLTHLYLVPYVAAATVDGPWREYCERAGRRLAKIGVELPYLKNIYGDTAAVLRALATEFGA